MTLVSRRELLRAAAAVPLAAMASRSIAAFQYHGALDVGIFLKAPWQAVGVDGEPLARRAGVPLVERFHLSIHRVQHRPSAGAHQAHRPVRRRPLSSTGHGPLWRGLSDADANGGHAGPAAGSRQLHRPETLPSPRACRSTRRLRAGHDQGGRRFAPRPRLRFVQTIQWRVARSAVVAPGHRRNRGVDARTGPTVDARGILVHVGTGSRGAPVVASAAAEHESSAAPVCGATCRVVFVVLLWSTSDRAASARQPRRHRETDSRPEVHPDRRRLSAGDGRLARRPAPHSAAASRRS